MAFVLKSLTCNYSEHPLSVNSTKPLFSWEMDSECRNVMQESYRLIVADSLDSINDGVGNIWDSGEVFSDKSVNITFGGDTLCSDSDYYWSVAVKTNKGSSIFEKTAQFSTAFLEQSDWNSAFIGPEKTENQYRSYQGTVKAYMLRNELKIEKTIKRARAYFCGLGWGELYINGKKVGDSVLDPMITDYRFSVPYVVYDVLEYIQNGGNAFGIMVGNGCFSEYRYKFAYGVSPKAMLQINIEYTDGSKQQFTTDKNWKLSCAPIFENRLWGGESYDARLEQPGWNLPDFDDSGWQMVKLKDRCLGIMKAQEIPPIKVQDIITPKEQGFDRLDNRTVVDGMFVHKESNVRIFDMQKLYGGWAGIKVKGEAGEKVTVFYSDRLDFEGYVDFNFQKTTNANGEDESDLPWRVCMDTYILNGNPDGEYYEPRFTLHPMRYVEIRCNAEKVSLLGVVGKQLYSDVDMTTSFECSNKLFNKIHLACLQALKNQTFGLPLDCLNREHFAYVDPATIAGTFYPRQFMPMFWRKWAEDIAEAQYTNGAIPDIAPLYIQDRHNTCPLWGGSFLRLAWYFAQYYDDIAFLEQHYDTLKRLFDYHSLGIRDGVLTEGIYNDHMVPGDYPGEEVYLSDENTGEYLWTGWYYEAASTLEKIATLLGNKEDKDYYHSIKEKTFQVINNKWFDKTHSVYDMGSQTGQYYALAAGFVPEEHRKAVLENALKVLQDKYNGHFRTGNTGTTAMIDSLSDCERLDVLYDIINSDSYPGWGYMIDNGATSIWESWSTENTAGCELSMTMYTTVEEFFYGDLAGINGPGYFGGGKFGDFGFKTATITPYIPEEMDFATADMRTVYGRLASSWKKVGDRIEFEYQIPVNTAAEVTLPFKSRCELYLDDVKLWAGGVPVATAEGVEFINLKGDKLKIKITSGKYKFVVADSTKEG